MFKQMNEGVPLGTKASCPKRSFRDNEKSVKLIGGFWEKAVFFSPCDTTAGLQCSSAGRSRITAMFALYEQLLVVMCDPQPFLVEGEGFFTEFWMSILY